MIESRIHAAIGTAYRGTIEAYRLLVASGWARSRYAMRAMDADGNPLPWLTYPAIEWLRRNVRPDWTISEYGCGQSTLWFRAQGCTVRSVEHDAEWAARIGGVTVASGADYIRLARASDTLAIVDGDRRDDCARHVAAVKPTMAMLDNADGFRTAGAILSAAYRHTIPFVGLTPGYTTQETALYLEPKP